MSADVAVIILTFNEEQNIAQALRSVCGWAREVYIVDSFSADRTVEIANSFECSVVQHAFEGYDLQRNWVLDHRPMQSEWILFLDADEWLPYALKSEISDMILSQPPENGFYIKRRFIWMGRWIRRGYYPTWLVRLFRRGKAQYEQRAVNEHVIVQGSVGLLKQDFMHEDRKSISDWIAKHNRYATLEALELLKVEDSSQEIPASFWRATQVERKQWLRYRVWNRMPPLLRPVLYFVYRLILCGGFLDGPRALIYHFLQALWFPLLIDIKYLELRAASRPSAGAPAAFEGTDGVRKSRC